MKKIHLSSVDSTNAYLKLNYKELDNYTFVSSDNQTNGRGRNNRQWKSENGKNLLFSLLILDKELIKHFKEISIISALTIVEILEEMDIKDVSIKWPNDVYVGTNKISGILLEAVTRDEVECLIVGVGINVNQKEFIGDYLTNPISILNIINREIDINGFKEVVYGRLIDNLESLLKGHDFYPYIYSHDYLKGKQAYASINNINELVQIHGINNDYSLKVSVNNKEKNIDFGEITFHI